jgi:hypothetical protein
MTDSITIIIVSPDDQVFLEPGDLAVVTTRSGSEYLVARDPVDGTFWLGTGTYGNMATARSRELPRGRSWRIAPPFIFVGFPAVFLAPMDLAFDAPARVPGGGKHTSPVVQVAVHREVVRCGGGDRTGPPPGGHGAAEAGTKGGPQL